MMPNSTFVSKLNPMTGKMEWQPQNDDYDYQQEIARSAYADMLHDRERNQKYYASIKKAVKIVHGRGQNANVLDIGTGTGLLSLMAAASGADKITACEAFHPMAACARQIIKKNGYEGKITVISKRSTELTVGTDGDLPERANILVTEVFDTELIGEGAISTFTHAHKELLTKDCLVIPRAANLFAQPVSSPFVRQWNSLFPISVAEGKVISVPQKFSSCAGATSLHDLQLDQLPFGTFTILSEPITVFRFDFSKSGALNYHRESGQVITALADGLSDAVFMWWNLEMDPDGEIILSCAPSWAHPEGKNLPWRDHWMQAIYYPPFPMELCQGQQFQLVSCHDEYSLWFDVQPLEQTNQVNLEFNFCNCGLHIVVSRTRLGMMNDVKRNEIFLKALKKVLMPESVVLTISDGSLLPIMAARLGAKRVFAINKEVGTSHLLEEYILANRLEDTITVLKGSPDDLADYGFDELKIDIVIGEPYFSKALLPWHHWYFSHAVHVLKDHLTPGAVVLPRAMSIRTIGVEFEHLWKIRAAVGNCEGFDITAFDELIASSEVADASVEPQPLWEYPCRPVTRPTTLVTLLWKEDLDQRNGFLADHVLDVVRRGQLNGMAVWTEFDFDDGLVISTGPVADLSLEERISWDIYSRQGVHLYPQPYMVTSRNHCDVKMTYNNDLGDFEFVFSVS